MSVDDVREFGHWTELKLEILRRYLDEFTTTTKNKARARVFLDAFAGQGVGRSRETGDVFEGSVRIALQTEGPPFTHLRFVEVDSTKARRLREDLSAEFPGRDILVYEGDCNQMVRLALADLADLAWAPTFAFLDPDGIQLKWSTVEALADHKRGHKFKVELWLLFSTMGLVRRLALDEEKLRPGDEQAASDAFGDDSWRPIYDARRDDRIDGKRARYEYINLYRWKLERELNYSHTFALEIRNDRGVPIYAMVFATDHEAGKRIMLNRYEDAARQAPERRKLVKARREGLQQMELSLGTTTALRDPLWVDPPDPPFAE